MTRCFGEGDELYERYHDAEWGVPVRDERGLYERLCLEGFQSGLAWITILRKREAFRRAFAGFDPERVADFGPDEVERLLEDAAIVRHRGKIEAAIGNARATLALRDGPQDLPSLVWSFAREPSPVRWTRWEDVPAATPESAALSKALRKAGFRFVGPTTAYAAMQACGLVDDHLAGCPVARERDALR